MANWNSGAYFNRKGNEGGFTWNSKYFLFTVRLNESLKAVDGLSEQLARLVLAEQPLKFYDQLVNSAFYGNLMDEIKMDEDPKVSLLFALAEEMGFKDKLTDFLVGLFLNERTDVIEETNLLAALLLDEDWDLNEAIDVHAFIQKAESYGLKDLATYFTEIFLFEKASITDRDVKQAISDFLIGAIEDDDRGYDWFSPMFVDFPNKRVGMRIDWRNTSLMTMPDAEHTSIEIPGVDGSLIQNTVYRERLFKITAFSDDGLTIAEKEDLKRRITEVLDATKHESKKLTVQARGIMFDAKYNNSQTTDGPSYVKLETEFTVPPYGADIFPNTLYGSGLVSNIDGAAPLRVEHKITGPISNPSFQLGAITYRYNGTVPSGKTLVISHDKYTCYLVNDFGNKTNALKNLTGEFQAIEAGTSMVLVANGATESHLVTEWVTPLLW